MMSIPFSVGKLLERAISRVRRLYLVRGLSVVGVVWILAIVAVMIVDSRIVIFDDRIRLAMSGGALLLALLTSVFTLLIPLRRRLDFGRMARLIDARHPEFEERFSTLVELSESDPAKAGFSAALFGKVGELAERDLGKVDLAHDFSAKAALRRLTVFAVLALTLVISIAVSPQLIGRLFVRAAAPWVDIGNLFANDIVVQPGDVVALSGTVIKIEAKPAQDGRLETRDTGFDIRISRKTSLGWSAETVEAMPNGVYETTADPNEREWRYRVHAGPAVTRYYHVRVSLMPKYDLFLAKVTYPDYTGLQPLVVSNGDVGAIKAIEGSRVNFDLRVTDPDTIADFKIGNEPVFEHVMVSNKTVNWSLDLVNRDGFRAEKGSHPLTSFIDQPPTVVIEKPTGTLRLPPHAKIPVEITANDDIGLADAYFRVSIDGEPWSRHFGSKIPLSTSQLSQPSQPLNPSFLRTVADVDLSLYDLIFAKNISFDVVVSDACPAEFGGPHSATSTPFTVQFAANEASWEVQELKSEVAQAQRDLDEARKRLNDAQNLARQVRDTLRREEKVSENTEKQSERLAHELTQAEKRIEELRDEFLADERFAPLTRPLDRMLDETLKPALEAIEQASFRERNERAEAVDDVLPEMEKARQEVDDFVKQLEERAKKVDAFEKAKDLAARQEALAKAAEEITSERPLDTAKLEAWKRLEEAAMQKADELARQDPDSDFSEAKRKMETAAREMAALKQELDAQKAEGERLKREADTAKAAAERKFGLQAQELAQAAADQQRAAEALAKTNLAAAAQSQQSADRHLKNAESLPAVKALQDLAAEATKLAKESQQSNNPNNRTVEQSQELQHAAAEATKAEQALREALANPTNKVDAQALENLDRKLRAELPKQQAAVDAAKAELDKAKLEAQAAEAAKKREAEQAKQTDAQQKQQAQALAAASADQKKAAEELAKGKPQNAAPAQRSAENNLKQGDATEGTKALQQAAAKAAEAAAQAAAQRPDQAKSSTPDAALPTLKNAQAAQQAAAEALDKERELREAMAKGEKTADDLAALDRANREAAAAAEKKLDAAKAADKVTDLATAAEAQAEAQKALDAVAATRAEVAKERRDSDTPLDQQHQSALAEKEKAAAQAAKDAAAAQKTAGELLKRGEATEGTKAMQKLAEKAAAASQKAPHDVERAQRAAAAQQVAAKALNEEKAVREAMSAGEKTAADLEAFDRAAQAEAKAAEAAFDKAEKESAASDQLADRQQSAQSQELRQAANDQQRAVTAMKQAAQKRAEEAQFRAAKNTNAAEARAREAQNLERQAAEAQRAAEDRLERGEATDAVKAMQQLATTAARNARKAPQTKEKFDLAAAAQQAATEALQNELKIREGMRKGEMTEDDLAALDAQLKEGLLQMAGQRTQAARNAAEAAVQKAKDAIGSEDEPEVSRLADAALDAARDAVSSALSESKLEGNDQRASELRDAEDALDAVDAEASEDEALENRILGLQQSAKEALERNDRYRAANLQKEIARAQARATDAVNGEEEVAARSAANAAQEKADEALDKASQSWNNETRAQAIAAQQAAIDAEREAQSEARSVRAMDKLAAAEKAADHEAAVNRPDQTTSASSEPAEAGDAQAASEAAAEASDAMDREVSAQAAALGMSKKSSSEKNQQGGAGKEKGDEESKGGGGGGVSEEVKKLAKELQRKDNPDFFKNLFARLGWFKIRDISKDGLGARDLKDVPREYRDLVRRYFLKLSEENPSSEGR